MRDSQIIHWANVALAPAGGGEVAWFLASTANALGGRQTNTTIAGAGFRLRHARIAPRSSPAPGDVRDIRAEPPAT